MTVDEYVAKYGDDELAHYGVLGMKWGKRKAEPGSPASTRREAHKQNYGEFNKTLSNLSAKGKGNDVNAVTAAGAKYEAKRKQINEEYKAQKKASKPVKPTTQDILAARARQTIRDRKFQEAQGDFMVARGAKGKNEAERIMRQMEKEYFTGDDAKTASRMTTGEKWVTGLSVASLALYVVGGTVAATRM